MSQTPLADQLAIISRDEFDRYMRDFRPTEQATVASLNDSTVGKAMDSSAQDSTRARASLERMRERYGTGTTPMQQAGEARQASLSGSLNQLSAGNTAFLADRDRKQQTLSGLMNVGQQQRQQALGNYSSAAGTEANRASADAANKSAYKQNQQASKQQTYASAAALAATAAMVFM